jgi:tetratricopeptide (TPR) repeat protein
MTYFVSLIIFLCASVMANPEHAHDEITKLRTDWAIAKYRTPKDQKLPELEKLIARAKAYYENHSDDAEASLWYGTILSTHAAIKGGLGELSNVKNAKNLLEESIGINDRIENGLAHGVLGALYARVPGWPIAFGSKTKAREQLEKAVRIDPQGSDVNYYYGDFLVDDGDYEEAHRHLEIAQNAPIRPDHEIQDRGRKEEISASLAKLRRLEER